MRNVIIIGAGGAGAEATFYIEDNNMKVNEDEKINILGYIDDNPDNWKKYQFNAPLLCDIHSYTPKPNEEVLIAIMNIDDRKRIINTLEKKKAKMGSFVHHSCIIPKNISIGFGNIIFPFCIVERNAIVGNYNFLTSYSFISHDCNVGNNNFFSTSGIAGNVQVGNNNYFGSRSTVIPGVKIGNNNIIQAGMVVNKHIKDDTTIFYRYKEQVLAIPKQD